MGLGKQYHQNQWTQMYIQQTNISPIPIWRMYNLTMYGEDKKYPSIHTYMHIYSLIFVEFEIGNVCSSIFILHTEG